MLQDKEIKVSLAALEKGTDESLPPLMNPTILEASDDLTNLSHLNEPAGMHPHSSILRLYGLDTNISSDFQSSKLSSFATSKKKSTHTLALC